jgi:hypothetical protein
LVNRLPADAQPLADLLQGQALGQQLLRLLPVPTDLEPMPAALIGNASGLPHRFLIQEDATSSAAGALSTAARPGNAAGAPAGDDDVAVSPTDQPALCRRSRDSSKLG